jgi:hypothetical protein
MKVKSSFSNTVSVTADKRGSSSRGIVPASSGPMVAAGSRGTGDVGGVGSLWDQSPAIARTPGDPTLWNFA